MSNVMGRRNWTSVYLDDKGGLVFDIRVERQKGHGETVGCDSLVQMQKCESAECCVPFYLGILLLPRHRGG